MPPLHDLTGKQFVRLTAAWPVGRAKDGTVMWTVFCKCGNFLTVRSRNLVTGCSKSCGCLKKEKARENGKRSCTHGMSRTPEYEAFAHAKARCNNSRNRAYKNYGGRGIQFRFSSFDEFFAELGPRPRGRSLDRTNNDSHYQRGNVRWATVKQQIHNRRPIQKTSRVRAIKIAA